MIFTAKRKKKGNKLKKGKGLFIVVEVIDSFDSGYYCYSLSIYYE